MPPVMMTKVMPMARKALMRHVFRHQHGVRGAEEVGRHDGEVGQHKDQGDEGARLEQEQEPIDVLAGRSGGCGGGGHAACSLFLVLSGVAAAITSAAFGARVEMRRDLSVRHHDDPVAERQNLFEVGGDENDSDALGGELAHGRGRSRPWRRCRCRARARPSAAPWAGSSAPCRSPPSAGCRPTATTPGFPGSPTLMVSRLM